MKKYELQDKEIYIYGAGIRGTKCYYHLKWNGISIRGFIDRDEDKQGYLFDGLYCYPIESIVRNKAIIIIAISCMTEIVCDELNSEGYSAYTENTFYEIFDGISAIVSNEKVSISSYDYLCNVHEEITHYFAADKIVETNSDIDCMLKDLQKRRMDYK